ncbi:MAG: TAXI family TRAP transporter solute-binding subunit [Burkholderiaceae bacterium]
MSTRDPLPAERGEPHAATTRRDLIERIADRFHISPREALIALLPVVLLLVLVGYVAQRFVRPAPPSTIQMTVGNPGGAYDEFAKRYQKILARSGVTLELHRSSGAVENYDRLRKPVEPGAVNYDVGFIQSGIGSVDEAPHLETIAGVYYEPVWLFSLHIDALQRLSDLKGKRIGVGIPGSGLRRLSLQMLAAAGVNENNATLVEQNGPDAVKALQDGKLDIAFLIGAPESPLIRSLFGSSLHIVSLAQSEAIARYFPTLTPLVLPQGAVDLADGKPSHDVRLLAATSMLVARDDLHPALVSLLLEAATEVHGGPGLFQQRGEFPSAKVQDFPISEQASRWFKSGRPFLQRYLPFWLANLFERLLVIIVPIVALMIPLMRIVPALYSWRVRSKVFRWYGEVKALEVRALGGHGDEGIKREEAMRLEEIERAVGALKIPLSFYHEVHLLRAHIDMVRRHLVFDIATPPEHPVAA